ncbi:SDR family oxidoreductase, partial [Salinispora arenicola]|uniref:SDR family oxidoreductase n=1 Tax=Salinispora arenicola TaxID=168697 RepID=UPI0027DCECF6
MWAKQAIAATPSLAYSMAKAGLHALTQHLAMELAAHKIRVNAVSPGRGRHPPSTRASSRPPRSTPLWPASTASTRSAGSAPPPTSRPPSSSCSPSRPAGSPARSG